MKEQTQLKAQTQDLNNQLDQKNKRKQFITKHSSDLSKQFKALENPLLYTKITILSSQQVEKAALQIKNNRLVAFPTQTVYGLGANALSQAALLDIYKVKKRPLTDPIIVHVLDFQHAKHLVKVTPKQQALVAILTDKFWPGPLTLILQANLQVLPAVVTANTGFVGIRAPKHPYARQLLRVSQLPIGAPSANLFAHVSPTSSVHVFNDFYGENISLVDGNRCQYGVESTVIKVAVDGKSIQILRQGSLSANILNQYLQTVCLDKQIQVPKVELNIRTINKNSNENMQAPGQLLKHYSPYLPCFYSQSVKKVDKELIMSLKNVAFMAFVNQYQEYKPYCKYYFDVREEQSVQIQQNENSQLFCSKQEQQLMKNLYFLLRKCENLDVEAIVLGWEGQKKGTIWDKIFRATQGKIFNKPLN